MVGGSEKQVKGQRAACSLGGAGTACEGENLIVARSGSPDKSANRVGVCDVGNMTTGTFQTQLLVLNMIYCDVEPRFFVLLEQGLCVFLKSLSLRLDLSRAHPGWVHQPLSKATPFELYLEGIASECVREGREYKCVFLSNFPLIKNVFWIYIYLHLNYQNVPWEAFFPFEASSLTLPEATFRHK